MTNKQQTEAEVMLKGFKKQFEEELNEEINQNQKQVKFQCDQALKILPHEQETQTNKVIEHQKEFNDISQIEHTQEYQEDHKDHYENQEIRKQFIQCLAMQNGNEKKDQSYPIIGINQLSYVKENQKKIQSVSNSLHQITKIEKNGEISEKSMEKLQKNQHQMNQKKKSFPNRSNDMHLHILAQNNINSEAKQEFDVKGNQKDTLPMSKVVEKQLKLTLPKKRSDQVIEQSIHQKQIKEVSDVQSHDKKQQTPSHRCRDADVNSDKKKKKAKKIIKKQSSHNSVSSVDQINIYEDQSESNSNDSYEEYQQYKKKKSKSVKFLIKRVQTLEKKVKYLKKQKEQAISLAKQIQYKSLKNIQKNASEIKREIHFNKKIMQSDKKQICIKSNVISINLAAENINIKENIVEELKKLKQKVQNLQNKSNYLEKSQVNSRSIIHQQSEQKISILDQISSQQQVQIKKADQESPQGKSNFKKSTGKILKRSELSAAGNYPQDSSNKQLNQKNDKIEYKMEENEKKAVNQISNQLNTGDAISVMKNRVQLKKMIQGNQEIIENRSKAFSERPGEKKYQNKMQNYPKEMEAQKFQKFMQNQSNQIFEETENRRFVRTGKQKVSPIHRNQRSGQDWSNSMKMLEFDTGKEKLIIDSKDTEELQKNQTYKHSLQEGAVFNYENAGKLISPFPSLPDPPSPNSTQDELIDLGKMLFNNFNVSKINNDSTVLIVKRYKNCVYFGLDSQNTILWHFDGKFYFGGWKQIYHQEGEKFGEGLEFQEGKYIYQGHFNDGKRNGLGVLKIINPKSISIYVGQFIDNLKHGKGKQADQTGTLYEGQWKEGKKDGLGKLILNDYEFYQGRFQKGLKSGHGIEYFKNNDNYKGEYLNGKFDGKGRYQWSNESYYEGQFREGMRNGFGVWVSQASKGDIYEGNYKNDLKHGPGIYKWSNGTVYTGQFYQDKKHGKGNILYPNGKIARLQWQEGTLLRKLDDEESINEIVSSATDIKTASKMLPVNRNYSRRSEKSQPHQKNIHNVHHQHYQNDQKSNQLKKTISLKKQTQGNGQNLINRQAFKTIKKGTNEKGYEMMPNNSQFQRSERTHHKKQVQPVNEWTDEYPNGLQKQYKIGAGIMHEITERPMTHKIERQRNSQSKNDDMEKHLMSNFSTSIKFKGDKKRMEDHSMPKDPPYRGMRASTNIISLG